MIQKILIFINLIGVLGSVGLVLYSHLMIKPVATDQKAEAQKLQTEAKQNLEIKPVMIKKFVVNLSSKASRLRYLDLEMNLMPFYEDQASVIKEHEFLIKDIVVEIASHMQPEDLENVTGKILLENKIKKQVNQKFGQPVIKQIFFSGFVVQ